MPISPCDLSTYAISPQGRELINHGTPLFPVAFYHDDLERDNVPWHWHDEFEAVVVEAGETEVSAGIRHYTLGAGQGFFVNAGVLHAAQGRVGTHCKYHSVVFHPRLIGGGIDSVFWQAYLRPLIANGMKSVPLDGAQPWHRTALDAVEQAWQAGASDAPGFEFQVRAALSELVFLLCRQIPAQRSRATEKALRDAERIKQMLRFIDAHYADELTAPAIAASASVSESECLRCFRSTIGMPPIQYLKQYRVQKAAELLGATDRKIADIAASCGFQDISYFTRTFREIKAVTPGEYRRGCTRQGVGAISPQRRDA